MNYSEAIMGDEDFRLFSDEEEFSSYLETIQEQTEWRTIPVEEVKFSGVLSIDELDGGISEADEDTVNNGTQLFLNAEGERFPVRACGLASITDRAGVSGEFLKRLDAKELSQVLNLACEKVNVLPRAVSKKRSSDAQGKIAIVNGKVSAFLSANGGNNEYSVQPSLSIMKKVEEAVKEISSVMDFKGSFSYSEVYAKWILNKTLDGVLEKDETGLPYHVAITLATSDCGISAVRLSASLIREKSNLEIPLVGEEKIVHRNEITDKDIQESVKKISAAITKNSDMLKKLDCILVNYPETAMKRVAKSLKLPKRPVMNAIAAAMLMYGKQPMSALECFTTISKCTGEYYTSQKNPEMQALLQRNLLKMLGIKWEAYDMPGEFNW